MGCCGCYEEQIFTLGGADHPRSGDHATREERLLELLARARHGPRLRAVADVGRDEVQQRQRQHLDVIPQW